MLATSTSPTGALAFLMTDIVGSTVLWERFPDTMERALPLHDDLIECQVRLAGGKVIKSRGEGDSTFSVFSDPLGALIAATEVQRGLARPGPLRESRISLRIGLHYGEAILRDGDYFGRTVNRCARIRAAAVPGQILASGSFRSALGEVLPTDISLRDLGLHRLRDLQEPERLHEVCGSQLPEPRGHVRTLTPLPNNLPFQANTFVGRRDDIVEVRALLGRAGLVSIVGPGGCGKTRFAVQVAAEVSDLFPSGVWFVPLAGLPSDTTPEQLVCSSLGRLDGSQDIDLETFARSLGGQGSLLVLDNCEHLLPTARALVTRLIDVSPELKILTTTRQALGLEAERVYQLDPLSIPPQGANVAEALRSDAVQLFLERVSARNPSFELNERNVSTVGDLVRAIEGLPLAIEFVSSHMRSLGPRGILKRLGEYLHPSYSGPSQDPRHQTMEAAIRWSFEALTEPEQWVYDRVATFPDGFLLEAAESICAQSASPCEDVPEVIAALVERSLLVAQEDAVGEHRYRMLEPFREFSRSRIGEPDQATKEAFCGWYVELAVSAERNIEGDQQALWLGRLDLEIDNIRQALRWTFEAQPHRLHRLVYGLRDYWTRRGNLREAVEWHERAVSCSEPASPDQARLLNSMGALLWKLGDLAGAERCYTRCLGMANDLNDPQFSATVRNNVAMLQDMAGRKSEARQSYLLNLGVFREIRDRHSEATTLSNLGTMDARAGDFSLAVEHLLEALSLFEELGNVAKIARVRCNLAEAYHLEGSTTVAIGHLESSFECWKEVPDPHFMGEGALLLGIICHELDFDDDALYLVLASEALLRRCSASLGQDEADQQRRVLQQLRMRIHGTRYDRIKGEAASAPNAAIVAKALGVCSQLQSLPARASGVGPILLG
jgi:predicted ATPase/class 3 adenylate cyclase